MNRSTWGLATVALAACAEACTSVAGVGPTPVTSPEQLAVVRDFEDMQVRSSRRDRSLAVLQYAVGIADNASTFLAIHTSRVPGRVSESNPARKWLIDLGPVESTLMSAYVSYGAFRVSQALIARGHPNIAAAARLGAIFGHFVGIGNNTCVIIHQRRGRRG